MVSPGKADKVADFLQSLPVFGHEDESKECENSSRIPSRVAYVRNLLKMHQGELSVGLVKAKDPGQVIEEFHIIPPSRFVSDDSGSIVELAFQLVIIFSSSQLQKNTRYLGSLSLRIIPGP